LALTAEYLNDSLHDDILLSKGLEFVEEENGIFKQLNKCIVYGQMRVQAHNLNQSNI